VQSSNDFYVFEKWLKAPSGAFGIEGVAAVVPEQDREAYWHIFSEILDTANQVIESIGPKKLYLRPKNYSRIRGSRGHRPVDLWVSICANGANLFGHMPQVYAIASDRGLEVGFAASIPEDDYFDPNVKSRNRATVPLINARLPEPDSQAAATLEAALASDGGWIFCTQTRLNPLVQGFKPFASLAEMLHHLKTNGASAGGGCIARYYSPQEVQALDLNAELNLALTRFAPLLFAARPTEWDARVLEDKGQVAKNLDASHFDPNSIEDGRKWVLAQLSLRQGQAKFRGALMKAYDGRCAVTKCDTPDVLQAAHIMPYRGPATNHPTNGILLRGDIHTLFDLNLLKIDPKEMRVVLSPAIMYSDYASLDGQPLYLPSKSSLHPSREALESRWDSTAETKRI